MDFEVITRNDIPSSYGKFKIFSNHQIIYPQCIIDALKGICRENERVVSDIAYQHTESPTDYRFLKLNNDRDDFINLFVQVDMGGLSDIFLADADKFPPHILSTILKNRIFEIDDSLAMYNLMRDIHSVDGPSSFKTRFDSALEEVRLRTGRKIAILATSDEKYESILRTELGILDGSTPSDDYVRRTIGFDRAFGPSAFKKHLQENENFSKYALYVRTSPSFDDLKNPNGKPISELLVNPTYRRIIRANSLTINVDDPASNVVLSDSKAALPIMGMGYRANSLADIDSGTFLEWLVSRGLTPDMFVRAKPIYGAYGAHGAFTTPVRNLLGARLENAIEKWGPYLIQPEILAATIRNNWDKKEYGFVDRLFIYSRCDGSGEFIGGLRNYMPTTSKEAKKNNYHGNSDAVWGEIVSQ